MAERRFRSVIQGTFINVRVPVLLHEQFYNKIPRNENPADVIRNILQAFVDDRLTIKPKEN